MKITINFMKDNKIVIFMFVLGIIMTYSSVYATTVLSSTDVSYNNTNSELSSNNVQDAIDEVYEKVDIRNYDNIVSAYTYDSSTCVTGEEDACVKTDCYKDMTANSCKAGDIIKYKVNDTDIVTFHIMYDNGTTMTMQSQKNTINNIPWISASDYSIYNADGTSCSYESCNDEGPMTALVALERATKSWTNVNNQTYTMGTTQFKINSFTGCSSSNECATSAYTLDERTAKARMITVQEANNLGCTGASRSCPIWMNNYLYDSTSYGGTVNDNTKDTSTGSFNYGYWTMNSYISYADNAWRVRSFGSVLGNNTFYAHTGVRAVVVINK